MCTFDKILEVAKSKGITQVQLANHLGVGKQAVSEWKKGRSTAYMKRIGEIAKFLDVSVDYLVSDDADDSVQAFDEHGEPLFIDDEVREIVNTLRTRPEMKILFSASKKATKEDIERAVKIIEALREEGDND